MSSVVEYKNGKPTIKNVETFCSLTNFALPRSDTSFRELFKEIDKKVKGEHPKVTQGALNNCHGDWYEWLIAIQAWNYRIKYQKRQLMLLLPNISRADLASLYVEGLNNHLVDLRLKVEKSNNVKLITSNPDFVILDIDEDKLPSLDEEPITQVTPQNIRYLEECYKHFIGKCNFNNIVGYFSVKTSLRPDRRLQLAHEGSLLKALYVHLQTRDWIIEPIGLKYYAASQSVTKADREGLQTVATHSITNVQSIPQAAVDHVFSIDNINEIESALSEIIIY
ncbi:Cfr10I/Bse634I family restriction endonuclease [Algicola sagamiensis]|uniref:Cfr10I/Bse634I family restriction endonuclease n=1 Tax=Algicola sagamiensis TaxID=163869 RepID=UPI00058DF305|nr:Cfr10I/Bse634I family restriction endonuclease [Algicola sagamiensis]